MIIMFVPPELMSPTKGFDLKELLLFLFASIIQVNISLCVCVMCVAYVCMYVYLCMCVYVCVCVCTRGRREWQVLGNTTDCVNRFNVRTF